MTWRIYHCRECGEVLGVGTTFPDDGIAKHEDPRPVASTDGTKAGWVHTDSALYETPNEPPSKDAQAVLAWAKDQIETGKATEISA